MYLRTGLFVKKNQSVMVSFIEDAYTKVSFLKSLTNTPSTNILSKSLMSTCFTSTVVFNSFDKTLEALVTSQFCTGVTCIKPQSEKNRITKNRRKEILRFAVVNSKPHEAAQAVRPKANIHLLIGCTYIKRKPNTSQKSSVSKIHFNMFKTLCRVNY